MSGLSPERRTALQSIIAARQAEGDHELISASLREAIVTGHLHPGMPLRQAQLAGVFGTSRIPVREALRLLESEGLVTSLPNRGFTVRAINADDVDDVYDLRILLEGHAVRLVVPSLTPSDIDRLEMLFERFRHAPTAAEHLQAREAFYAGLYALAGRPRLLALIVRLRQDVARVFGWATIHHSTAAHEAFFELVRRGDADGAAAELTRHYERVRQLLVRTIRSEGPTSGGTAPPRLPGRAT